MLQVLQQTPITITCRSTASLISELCWNNPIFTDPDVGRITCKMPVDYEVNGFTSEVSSFGHVLRLPFKIFDPFSTSAVSMVGKFGWVEKYDQGSHDDKDEADLNEEEEDEFPEEEIDEDDDDEFENEEEVINDNGNGGEHLDEDEEEDEDDDFDLEEDEFEEDIEEDDGDLDLDEDDEDIAIDDEDLDIDEEDEEDIDNRDIT